MEKTSIMKKNKSGRQALQQLCHRKNQRVGVPAVGVEQALPGITWKYMRDMNRFIHTGEYLAVFLFQNTRRTEGEMRQYEATRHALYSQSTPAQYSLHSLYIHHPLTLHPLHAATHALPPHSTSTSRHYTSTLRHCTSTLRHFASTLRHFASASRHYTSTLRHFTAATHPLYTTMHPLHAITHPLYVTSQLLHIHSTPLCIHSTPLCIHFTPLSLQYIELSWVFSNLWIGKWFPLLHPT
jgi:hypothetical protein